MPSSTALLTTLLALSTTADAFQVHSNHGAVKKMTTRQNKSFLSMTDTQSEVEKLRAAAAKAREEYERLSKEMGKEVTSSGDVTDARAAKVQTKNLSVDEVKSIATDIDFSSGDANSQTTALDNLVQSGDFSLWKSAVRRPGSNMSLLVPFPVSLGNLESRTDGKVTGESLGVGGEGDVKFEDFQDLTVAVVLGSTLLGILSLAVLPRMLEQHSPTCLHSFLSVLLALGPPLPESLLPLFRVHVVPRRMRTHDVNVSVAMRLDTSYVGTFVDYQ
jgi:hypothetical protein